MITLITIGKRMPAWVETAYHHYAKQLPHEYRLHLIEIDAKKRLKNAAIEKLLEQEGEQLLAAVPARNYLIALDRAGKQIDTQMLATHMQTWSREGLQVSLLIGGPEGLSPQCLARANETWSLSKLTLPHPLVRVIVAEQIYRAFSILNHHPYHR